MIKQNDSNDKKPVTRMIQPRKSMIPMIPPMTNDESNDPNERPNDSNDEKNNGSNDKTTDKTNDQNTVLPMINSHRFNVEKPRFQTINLRILSSGFRPNLRCTSGFPCPDFRNLSV